MIVRAGLRAALLVAGMVTFDPSVMARDQLDAVEVRKHLDRHYPFIDQGAEPPQGKIGWRTRHGSAVVLWQGKRPIRVWHALLPNGAAVEASANMGSPLPWRYRLSGEPRHWQHGTVEIRDDGVTFTPGELPPYDPPVIVDGPDLEVDLAGDEAFRRRLADENFADTLYGYLKNGEFWKEGGERIWVIGLSRAGSLVARLRGHGDIYLDYYPYGRAAPLTDAMLEMRRRLGHELTPEQAAVQAERKARFDEIANMLRSIGWRRATAEDKATAAIYTRRDLAAWEERPSSDAAEWAQKLRPQSPPQGRVVLRARPAREMSDQERERHEEIASQSLQKRLYALAISGRIVEPEYHSMTQRISQIP